MKQSKDPFEAAFEESPPESPNPSEELEAEAEADAAVGAAAAAGAASARQNHPIHVVPRREEEEDEEEQEDYDGDYDDEFSRKGDGGANGSGGGVAAPAASSAAPSISASTSASARTKPRTKDDFDEEDDDNMDVELSKFPSSGDPDKMAKMQSILSRFTEHQMSRYESFRRSALQKANMKRLLVSITGTQKISLPMTIVVCGIAKMFVGELVETARVVMTERKESGPIRPCHIREAYRRLKLEGKVPKRSVPRLFW